MSLWMDKWRPKTLSDAGLHASLNDRLSQLAQTGDVSHLLFHGPNGAGKRTRILAFLNELFGASVQKVKLEQRPFKISGGRDIVISTLYSSHHIELNPSDLGAADRHVIQNLFREIADTNSVRPPDPLNLPNEEKVVAGFKVVVLSEADKMSEAAQLALRRTMEKYMRSCRLILCCENLNRITTPIKSRCQLIRVPAPPIDELSLLLQSISAAENKPITAEQAMDVAIKSGRNVRQALLMLQNPASCDWQEAVAKVTRNIIEEPSIESLQRARERLLEVLTGNVPPDMVLDSIARAAAHAENIDKNRVLKEVADADWRLANGTKPIFHLDLLLNKIALAAAEK